MSGFPVRLEGVSKTYSLGGQQIPALRRMTLTVPPKGAVAVTGPSGSGKSTLLHVIGAMDVVDDGTISVGEFEVTSLSRQQQVDYRRRIGFVFQRFHLLPALTALDNVIAPLLPQKVAFDKVARGRELLLAVGLGDRASALPSELSGGQQQRVAVARALVNRPQLLLADEPTGNLDSETGALVLELLLSLRAEHGFTVMVGTHDPLVAGGCDRVITLRDGELVHDTELSQESALHGPRTISGTASSRKGTGAGKPDVV